MFYALTTVSLLLTPLMCVYIHISGYEYKCGIFQIPVLASVRFRSIPPNYGSHIKLPNLSDICQMSTKTMIQPRSCIIRYSC